jgi:hypothetical protein
MVRLIDKSTGKLLGRITEEDLQFLVDNLAALLEGAMGEGDEIEIGYEKG